jgi:hypothetical protein
MWWWDGGHFDARVAIFSAALRNLYYSCIQGLSCENHNY